MTIDRIRDGLLAGGYWFIGGYSLTWFTPYALQAALIGLIIGELLLAAILLIEDQGGLRIAADSRLCAIYTAADNDAGWGPSIWL